MKKCLVSGSFDPITIGHLDIINKASKKFDIVIVGVFNNEEKQYLFDLNTRVKLCQIATNNIKNVQVVGNSGMVSDFCLENEIDCIIRGFRNNVDYNYETQMADYNYKHCGIITYLIPADKDYYNVSSSVVRECIDTNKNSEIINNFLPKEVWAEIRRIKNA